MNTKLLTDIPFSTDVDSLIRVLRVKNAADQAALAQLVAEAMRIGRPKAAYRAVLLQEVGEAQVRIDGTEFHSRVLAVNLKDAHRVFLFMATCGTELNDWAHGLEDMVHQFWAEEIKIRALRAAVSALEKDLNATFAPGKTSTMNPGSLADWPLAQQRPFFTVMAEAAQALGVTLSDSCLMTPNKSVTGIRFPVEGGFESCQLCPMLDCPNRRAPYDQDLFERRYAQAAD
ncbi:MAG: vitamin B12 dependent methionine synthase [Anaerolineae bacterium]|jgi:hypothetical protein|nr:vitamin B12 dependent methionine synthase [Chloroflexota bacterium]